MPLPPLPPSNTIRYFADYSTATVSHTAIIRANAVASPANIGALLNSIFTSFSNVASAITFHTLRVAVVGSDVTNPVVSGFEGTIYGAGGESEASRVTSLNFVGRSSGGRRVRFSLFGYTGPISSWRLTNSENVNVAAINATMVSAVNSFYSIDGIKPLWYPYANVSFNAYWQKELRV